MYIYVHCFLICKSNIYDLKYMFSPIHIEHVDIWRKQFTINKGKMMHDMYLCVYTIDLKK